MRRQRSADSFLHSDSSELDIDLVAEIELNKLQRQYHVTERAKEVYRREAQDVIRRQQSEIRRLQREREEMLSSLGDHRLATAAATQNLSQMLVVGDKIDEDLEAKKRELTFLKDETLRWERKLAGQRTAGGATHRNQSSPQQKSDSSRLLRDTQVLANKLDRCRVRLNKLLSKNAQLREELKTLHVERKQFLHIHSSMEKELHGIHKDIRDLMAQCTAAFESRAVAHGKRSMLKEKEAKDLAEYSKERSELEQFLSHDRKLKAFLGVKATERTSQEEAQDISRKQEEQRKKLDSRERWLEAFHDVVAKLYRETGEKDLDKLVTTFTEMEEQNYALINFVNSQHNEAETIQKQIIQLRGEMEHYGVEKQREVSEQQAVMRAASIQQQTTEEQVATYQQHSVSLDKILDQLSKGVHTVFCNINCDRSVLDCQLGSSGGIQEHNIMAYLAVVEHRTNELLSTQSYLHSKELDIYYSLRSLAQQFPGQSPQGSTHSSVVKPPTTRDDMELEESSLLERTKPLSKDTLLQLVNKRILRKAKTVHP